jgi:2,3,4,5-tetrahydropyridine-2-carboxylate N-succinyltransferase
MNELSERIENNTATEADIRELMSLLDAGKVRVAEKHDGKWQVNGWVKQGLLGFFQYCPMQESTVDTMRFRDIFPLKQEFENVRIVPGGNSVRYGSYLANGVVMMPPAFVNTGAFVDKGTMIDSNALVGSCAQIGKNVHLSAGVQIGGVLEPAQATPTIIEDEAFIGAGAIVVEGVIVGARAVIAPGVVLSASVKILETDANGKIVKEHVGEIPADAIVVPGARQRGEVQLQTPIIIGYRNERTNEKVGINELLRDF